MTNFIDTHAHLAFSDFDADREEVIAGAAKEGVMPIICVSASIDEAKKAVAIASSHPGVFAAVGLHPQNVRPQEGGSLGEQLKQLENLASHPKVVAIGEFGFDLSPTLPPEADRSLAEQEELFAAQMSLAEKLNKPVIIHTRQAREITLARLTVAAKRFPLRGVVHCFTEDWEYAQSILDLGLLISFTGILTFPKSLPLWEVAKQVPWEKIMLETDCPFLAPQPVRGQRNEPKYVRMVAEKVAEIKGVSLEDVASITSKNALKLFNIPSAIS